MNVQDKFTEEEFEDILNAALENTANQWETDFVNDMVIKWEKWGKRMYISDTQLEHLYRIAEDNA